MATARERNVRVAFIGQDSQRAKAFIKHAQFVNGGSLPKGSPQEKLLFVADKCQKFEYPRILIVDEDPKQLLKAAQEQRESLQDLNLTVITLGANVHRDTVDEETGIRVAHITQNEIDIFTKVHPTPNS